MVSVENLSQMLQVARNIDVGKDSGIVDLDMHDIGYIALQQTPCTVISLQCQQFIAVMGGKPDRMAAPAGAGGSRQGCPGQQRIAHARNSGRWYSGHIGQPDQPSGGIMVCAHAADEAGCHTLRSIRTFDPAYRIWIDRAQRSFDRAAKCFCTRFDNYCDMPKCLQPWQQTVRGERQCRASQRQRMKQLVRTEAARCSCCQHDGGDVALIRHRIAQTNFSWSNGMRRMRLPVNLNTALATAGAIGGKPGSPMPVGASLLATKCTSTCGISENLSGA
jgi:hypothetical protein